MEEQIKRVKKMDDPEYFKKYFTKYYQDKKGELLMKAKEIVICEGCNRPVCRSHLGRHRKTEIHKKGCQQIN